MGRVVLSIASSGVKKDSAEQNRSSHTSQSSGSQTRREAKSFKKNYAADKAEPHADEMAALSRRGILHCLAQRRKCVTFIILVLDNDSQSKPLRVGLISLGCAKNLVDAEIMLGSLIKSGIEVTNDAASADAVIVNTCSFIDAAQEESVDAILESDQVRQANNRGQALIVSGCLPQRFKEELPKLLPEVDAFMGIDQVEQVGEMVQKAVTHRAGRLDQASRGGKKKIVQKLAVLDKAKPAHPPENSGKSIVDVTHRPQYIPDYVTPRFRLTPRHFAYVKIAEGCNHPCSFCIIPRMRGSHRSRQQSDIVQEARQLVGEGVKEINLISQDSTYYGLDFRQSREGSIAAPERFTAATRALPQNSVTLNSLLRELNDIDGDFWIRLLYTHPAHWTDELIQTIAESRKVARYIDIPLQHIHGTMLERMRRETSREYIENLIQRIRTGIPGIALRTTFIVGFPGETEEYFQSLLEFINTAKFERLGVFTYSHEEGTRAGKMANQVPEKVKNRRREVAMAEQLKISRELAAKQVGRELRVLVESKASPERLQESSVSSWEHGVIRAGEAKTSLARGDYLVARGEADAPDIDGRVYIRGTSLPAGDFARVKVIGHGDYDLIAEAF